MMLFNYILLTSFLAGTMTWLMIQALRMRNQPPDSDDGGSGFDTSLPVVDMPPGASLSDWLTDRMPDVKHRVMS